MSTPEEIYRKVTNVLAEVLNIDKSAITPTATLQRDLGAESIDLLEIMFRLEGEFAIDIPSADKPRNMKLRFRLDAECLLKVRATVVVDDIVIHRHDGRKVYIRAQAKPVFEGDAMAYVVIAFIDITREVGQVGESRRITRTRFELRLKSLFKVSKEPLSRSPSGG